MGFHEAPVVWIDRDLEKMAPAVLEWTRVNHEALTRFGWDGPDWMEPDVRRFIDGLQKL